MVDLCGAYGCYPERYKALTKVLSFPFRDGTPIPEGTLEKVVLATNRARARGPVLIQCAAGLSRSTSVAYAVLRVLDELSHDAALARVKVHPDYPMRPVIDSARLWVQGVYQETHGRGAASVPGTGLVR